MAAPAPAPLPLPPPWGRAGCHGSHTAAAPPTWPRRPLHPTPCRARDLGRRSGGGAGRARWCPGAALSAPERRRELGEGRVRPEFPQLLRRHRRRHPAWKRAFARRCDAIRARRQGGGTGGGGALSVGSRRSRASLAHLPRRPPASAPALPAGIAGRRRRERCSAGAPRAAVPRAERGGRRCRPSLPFPSRRDPCARRSTRGTRGERGHRAAPGGRLCLRVRRCRSGSAPSPGPRTAPAAFRARRFLFIYFLNPFFPVCSKTFFITAVISSTFKCRQKSRWIRNHLKPSWMKLGR